MKIIILYFKGAPTVLHAFVKINHPLILPEKVFINLLGESHSQVYTPASSVYQLAVICRHTLQIEQHYKFLSHRINLKP